MNDTRIISALDRLKPISLEDTDSVRLMNRIETKYLFSVKKLEDLLSLLESKYYVLEIDKSRAFRYQTTYMDTLNYHFYNQHVRGELERHKIRFRKYNITGISYLEIKKKTNKGRTIKKRIISNLISDSFDDNAMNFINEYSPVKYTYLKPALISSYTRVTAIGMESKERITFDFNISFSEINGGNQIAFPHLAVAELKSADVTLCTPFKGIIKNMKIYPTGFSKYCIGSASLNGALKKNIVKPKLLLIKKIENEHVISNSHESD